MFNIGDKVKIVRPLLYSQRLCEGIVGTVADCWEMDWGEKYIRIQYEEESGDFSVIIVSSNRCEKC